MGLLDLRRLSLVDLVNHQLVDMDGSAGAGRLARRHVTGRVEARRHALHFIHVIDSEEHFGLVSTPVSLRRMRRYSDQTFTMLLSVISIDVEAATTLSISPTLALNDMTRPSR